MSSELSLSERRVLRLLTAIRYPIGYFGLVARLELQRKPLREHLLVILERLEGLALITCQPALGHRSTVYAITDAGRELLEREYPLHEPH